MRVEIDDAIAEAVADPDHPEHRLHNQPCEVTRVAGDREHPLSKGYLCVKGKASLDLTLSEKRVVHPLKRVGERGSGQWQRVSWDDALDDIAQRFNAIIDAHGARAVSVQALPPKEYFAYDIFCDAIGSPTFFKHDSHQCFTPQLMSDVLTYGNLFTYPSFINVEDAEVILLWGVNLAETNGSKGQRVRDAQRKRGAKTIVVDPRPVKAAADADLWLRVRPGTDAALALGMINVMIEENLYDADFVAEWTEGFEDLKARAALYPPERVAEISWVPADDIRQAARMFATASNSALYTFIGATMGGNSIATLRLMGFLPALTGRIDTAGNNGFLAPIKVRMPSYYSSNESHEGRNLTDQLSADRFPLLAGPDAITTAYPHPRQVIDAMLTGEPYPVRALWTDCNPVVGLEDSYTTVEALKSLDLLIVSDMFESPTAHLADYILPITTHLESNAITEYSGLNMISARVRAMEPRGEAREEGEIVLDVLKRMGYADKLPVKSYRDLLDYRLASLDIDFDAFAKLHDYVGTDEPQKYRSGKMRADAKPGFNTKSGKIEFRSSTLAAHGYDPLPDFVEPPYSPTATPELAQEYPLILVSGTRSVEFYSTLGIEVPRLRKRRPWPVLEMAPETAADYGIDDGDWIEIAAPTTERTIKRRIALLPGMHPRVVNAEGLWYMPGCEDLVEGALEVGANVLTPLTDEVDPVIGGSIARCLLAKVRKLEPQAVPRAAA
jgi:anaerobic selenocysteine-containing dehydrogenase